MTATKKIRLTLLALLVVIVLSTALVWKNFLTTPLVTSEKGLIYKVHLGASFKSVAADLEAKHITSHPILFSALVRLRGVKHELKAGEYYFPKGTTPNALIDQVISGRGLILHTFTIIAGTTFKQVRATLNNDPEFLHTTKNLSDASIMKMLGHPGLHPEGQFFPDTYYFVADSSDLILLKRAYKAMQKKLQKAWGSRTPQLPLQNPYQALIAASIIEKEAHLDTERPIIAGVMMNRLRQNIILQFDPTVIYGMGAKYKGVIHRSDLLAKNPYNSYVNKGLPPTPIAMPGEASIQAATHPDKNDYIFFVAKGDHISHQFSKTLAEHRAAIAASKRFHVKFFNSSLIQKYLLKSTPLKPFLQAN